MERWGVEEEMGLWKTEAANNKPRIESRCEERRKRAEAGITATDGDRGEELKRSSER